jgi:hypothetical protein
MTTSNALTRVPENVDIDTTIRGKIIVTANGEDWVLDMEPFGITVDSSNSEIMDSISAAVKEQLGRDISEHFKIEKALNSGNIYVYPASVAGVSEMLSSLSNDARLKIYDRIIAGCTHIWSKNSLQEDKLNDVLSDFMILAEKDPEFLAKFTSYAVTKLDSKDLKVVTVFANSLSDADGTPFSPGSKYKKPNWRMVSQAALQTPAFDAKLVSRVIDIANRKVKLGENGRFKEGTHFSRPLKKAITKYLRFREMNLKVLTGIKKVGLGKTYSSLYRMVHKSPSTEAASILGWDQKDGRKIEKKIFFDFKGLSDIQIAEKIRKEKLAPTGALGALPNKISPVIAAAILEQASGDQAVILRGMFDEQGLLKHKEVLDVFTAKVKTAKTALDRVERLNTEIAEPVSKALKTAKSEKRKADVGDLGKIFLHIDSSSSLDCAIDLAKDLGATLAECVTNPKENFGWGHFGSTGTHLPNPKSFEKDAFHAALYNVRAYGNTDCVALYEYACANKFSTQVYITDGGHNVGDAHSRIEAIHAKGFKPDVVLIIKVGCYSSQLAMAFIRAGVAVTEMDPSALKESALVSQAVKTALKGREAIIEEIMSTPLLKLPDWWESVSSK